MTRFARLTYAALLSRCWHRPRPPLLRRREVTGVSLLPSPGKAELVIGLYGAVTVKDFTLANPSRIVLDLTGATLATPAEPVYDGVARAGVINVRVRQILPGRRAHRARPRSRPGLHRPPEDGQVRVTFGADESFLAWSSGGPAAARSLPEAAPASASVVPAPIGMVRVDRNDRSGAGRSYAPQQRQEPRITVSWDNAEIYDVVSGFQALSGRTIILGKGVNGQVTAEIRDKPWSQAFQAILAAQGLSAQEMPGGIIRVDAPSALAEIDSLEPLETQVVRVNYARAGELGKSIEGILTKNRGKVNADTGVQLADHHRYQVATWPSIVDFARGLDIRHAAGVDPGQDHLRRPHRPRAARRQVRPGLEQPVLQQAGAAPRPGRRAGRRLPEQRERGGPGRQRGLRHRQRQLRHPALRDRPGVLDRARRVLAHRFLSALERVDLSDVQAEPIITTHDNKKADIIVGEEMPVRIMDYSTSGGGAGSSPGPRCSSRKPVSS